jgi:hypothetical protein
VMLFCSAYFVITTWLILQVPRRCPSPMNCGSLFTYPGPPHRIDARRGKCLRAGLRLQVDFRPCGCVSF